MVKRKTKRLLKNILIYGGFLTIIITHTPIVVSELPTSVSRIHGLINISAAIGMLIGSLWRMR